MGGEFTLPDTDLIPSGLLAQMSVRGWNLRTGGAVGCLCCGIVTPIIGSVLTAIAWLTGPEWHGLFLQREGTVLLFLTIPLLIFGAHCLDLSDRHAAKASKS